MSDEVISFDAHISIMRQGGETDQAAAERLLEIMLDNEISCALHRDGTLFERGKAQAAAELEQYRRFAEAAAPIFNVLAFDQKPRDAGIAYQSLCDARYAAELLPTKSSAASAVCPSSDDGAHKESTLVSGTCLRCEAPLPDKHSVPLTEGEQNVMHDALRASTKPVSPEDK